MASSVTPTRRSLIWLRKHGWEPDVVERRNPRSFNTHDLWGFADLIAMRAGDAPMLIQTTSASNLAARRAKVLAEPRAALAARVGFRIVLHGWRKAKVKRGGKAVRWTVNEIEIDPAAFASPPASDEAAPLGAAGPTTPKEEDDAED